MKGEMNFQDSLSTFIGHDEANEVSNDPGSSYSQGVPVTVDPVVRVNTEAGTSLGLDMRVGADDVSVSKNKVQTNEQKLASDISQTIGPDETRQMLADR